MNVAAKSSGPDATVPKPPDYTECVAAGARRRCRSRPKGQPKHDRRAAQDAVQAAVRAAARPGARAADLVRVDRGRGRGAGRQGHRRRGQEALRGAEEAVVPQGRRLPEVPQGLRADRGGHPACASGSTCSRTRSARRSPRARTRSPTRRSRATTTRTRRSFAQPERRDLRIVLTKTKAKAERGQGRARGRRSRWRQVAKEYSIDDASKAQGGKLPAVAKGQQEKAFDDAIFDAKKGELTGPVKTQFGYYVFEVDKITRGLAADARGGHGARSSSCSPRRTSRRRSTRSSRTSASAGRRRRTAATGYVTQDCKNAPKPTPTPTPARPARAAERRSEGG